MPPKCRTSYSGKRHQPIGSDNIGHKMLEKMGWSTGLGLGKHNQGNPESLQIRQKNDRYGLRCKKETAQSLPHQTAFEDLLGKLSSSNEELSIDCNAPLQTKIFRRQPRFTKVAKAKDVTSYAEKDLQGILGSGAKSIGADKSEVPQGSVPKTTYLCHNNSQTGCDNILNKINIPQSFEISEDRLSNTSADSKKISKKKGEKVWRKYDLGTCNEIQIDSFMSEHCPPETNDYRSCIKREKRKKRKQNLDTDCKNFLYYGERSEASDNYHTVDSDSNIPSSISNAYIDDFELMNSKERNYSFECEDAEKSMNLDSSFVDSSCAEDKSKICNEIPLKKPRQNKSSFRGDKIRSEEEYHLTDVSQSELSVATKPFRSHYMSYEDDEEDRKWKEKVLNSPALLAELCAGDRKSVV